MRTALFWTVAAHLAALPGVVLGDGLARIETGYGDAEFAFAARVGRRLPAWLLTPSLTLIIVPALPSPEHQWGRVRS